MHLRFVIPALFIFAFSLSLRAPQNNIHHKKPLKKYLALGDSYTIGESVPAEDNFPSQLVKRMNDAGLNFNPPNIIATTGWTTDELIKAIEERKPGHDYDLVTLLIGVNNQYRGYNILRYKYDFEKLLSDAVKYARGNKNHVVVISIPDYGVTPFAAEKNPQKIAAELDEYNGIAKEISDKQGVLFIDITPGSRKAAADSALVATDGLHPSSKMYSRWVDKIYPAALKAIAK